MAASTIKGGLQSKVILDVLRQRTGPTTVAKRRELADSLVQRILMAKGDSVDAAMAISAIAQAGQPSETAPGVPDIAAMDRLIEVDRKLGGVMRSTLIQSMVMQDHPARALLQLRSIATADTNTIAVTALFGMIEIASGGSQPSVDRLEAQRHLREMWDGDLVRFMPALNELACFADRAGWPRKSIRCHRG